MEVSSELIERIENLKTGEVGEIVRKRLKEFEELGKKKEDEIFSELCFCLLTANFQADKCIRIQKEVGRGFDLFPEDKLAEVLKQAGHRFWPQRASRIVKARECKQELCKMMNPNGRQMREWLVENVHGLGMKEASHFLRNIGYKDVAIIDFHIIDLLVDSGLIERPKTLTKKRYLEIEDVLSSLSKEVDLDLASLDLYLWYLETGKVLK